MDTQFLGGLALGIGVTMIAIVPMSWLLIRTLQKQVGILERQIAIEIQARKASKALEEWAEEIYQHPSIPQSPRDGDGEGW